MAVKPYFELNLQNSTTEEYRLLKAEELRHTMLLMSTIVFVALLVVIGLFGNIIVLRVYSTRIHKGTTRIFILALTTFDILTNIFGMPGEILSIIYSYTFTNSVLCRMYIFGNYITLFSSMYTLLAVAIDRQRKICHPFARQITDEGARIMVGFSILGAFFMAVPPTILNDVYTFSVNNLTASECQGYMKKFEHTPYPSMVTVVQTAMFVLGLLTLGISYGLIGRQIYKQSRFNIKKYGPAATSTQPREHISLNTCTKETPSSEKTSPVVLRVQEISLETSSGSSVSQVETGALMSSNLGTKTHIPTTEKDRKAKAIQIKIQTTLMFVAISVVFVLSNLPYIIICSLKRLDKTFVSSMSEIEYQIYHFFLRSPFIQTAANPIVYSFLNARFRNEAIRVVCPWRAKQ